MDRRYAPITENMQYDMEYLRSLMEPAPDLVKKIYSQDLRPEQEEEGYNSTHFSNFRSGFSEEMKKMLVLFGCEDSKQVRADTCKELEAQLILFIENICLQAVEVKHTRGDYTLTVKSVIEAVSSDPCLLQRAKEIDKNTKHAHKIKSMAKQG